MTEAVQILDLSTGFRQKKSLKVLHKGLNFSLEPGKLVCILGPNGAGKSTLLRTIIGFQPALSGEIKYGDQQLSKISVKELSRIISVVLTDKIDDFYLTAYEVVMTGRYPYGTLTGKLTEEDNTLILQAFESVGVSGLVDQNFYKLSDGEKQKVMIARAIAQHTPFIFLDEPVAFIDAPSRIGIMQLLDHFRRELKKGILMATHEIESALQYADELWMLGKDGEWYHGPPDEMVKKGYMNKIFDSEGVSFNKESHRFESKVRDQN